MRNVLFTNKSCVTSLVHLKTKVEQYSLLMVPNTERVAIPFGEISPPELSKRLDTFHLSSARKRDCSFYNQNSLT